DLQSLGLSHARFEPDPELPFPLLQYPKQWYLTREFGGCSCHFRAYLCEEPEFGPLEDWEEDDDDIEATRQIFALFKNIHQSGYGLDLLCLWQPVELEDIRAVRVSFTQVTIDSFRFFENYYFSFTK
ncbi:MAG: hypothetical protein ABL962_18630, partial [Fimbriimonadaceae bacterium]